jgi:hypothetical protein
MKTITCIAVLLVLCGSAIGASVQWTVSTDLLAIYAVIADGKGGCVCWGIRTNGHARVLWLDKKGESVFSQIVSNMVYGFTYGKRGLLYGSLPATKAESVLVDKKGTATTISDPSNHLFVSQSATIAAENMDKKGFFLIKAPTTPGGSVSIERCSYK